MGMHGGAGRAVATKLPQAAIAAAGHHRALERGRGRGRAGEARGCQREWEARQGSPIVARVLGHAVGRQREWRRIALACLPRRQIIEHLVGVIPPNLSHQMAYLVHIRPRAPIEKL